MNKIQTIGFDILKNIINICNKYNLKYYVYGGTLLGAYRHQGFIPWDDDIDIAMPRKDFEEFKLHVNELPSYMLLDTIKDKGHTWTAAHVVDKRYKLRVGRAKKRTTLNVWVDILIIDGVPNPNSFKFKLFGACYLFSRLLYKFSNFSNEVDLEKRRPLHESMLIKFALYTHIEIIINQQFAGKILDKISSLFDYDKCEYVATLGGPQKLKETQPKFWFGDGKPMQFENIIVNAMSHPENFLTKFYGKNFMTPPPINKRSQHNVELIEENNI